MISFKLLPLALILACVFSGATSGLVFADDANEAEAPREIVSFSRGPSGGSAVALTFDDGPHPRLTPQLLEILEAEKVPATFFMLGNMVEKYPEVARAVADSGHEVANHGYSHKELTKLSREKIHEEVFGTQDLIEQATGRRPTLFRAPYGSVNGTVRNELLDLDLELVGWAVDPRDWERGNTSERISGFILEHTNGSDIILLHDIHVRSVESVRSVIQGLREKGYTFTTAGALIADKREEMKRIAEMPAPPPSSNASPSVVDLPPARPPVVPLGKSSLKRYNPDTKSTVTP